MSPRAAIACKVSVNRSGYAAACAVNSANNNNRPRPRVDD